MTTRRSKKTPVAGATPASPGTAAGVAVGQIWQDCDPRHTTGDATRLLEVLEVNGGQAVCSVLWDVEGRGRRRASRRVRIQLVRLRPRANGYRLVYQPGAGTDGAGGEVSS